MNQRRITDLSSESADENFDELRVVLMRVFPNALAEFRVRENTARLQHQHFQQHQLPRGKPDAFRMI